MLTALLAGLAQSAAPAAPPEAPRPGLLAASRYGGELVVLDPETLEVRDRIALAQGVNDVEAAPDGRIVISPHYGYFRDRDAETGESAGWGVIDSTGYFLLDTATRETRLNALENCPRPHGAAAHASGHRFWITCEEAGTVIEVDALSGEVLAAHALEEGVHKVMTLSDGETLAATNPETGDAYIIRPDGEIAVIPVGAGAEALAASADPDRFWAAAGRDNTICAVNIPAAELERCFPAGGRFPIALAEDPRRGVVWAARLFEHDIAALDMETGDIVQTIPLGGFVLGMALDVEARRLYATLPGRDRIVMHDADTGERLATSGPVPDGDDIDLVPAAAFSGPGDT